MTEKKLLTVIIPGRNQGDILGKTIDDVAGFVPHTPFDAELIYIDGNSSDGSKKVADSKKDKFKNLLVLSDPPDMRGKGGAIKSGMAHAKGDFMMFMDADNSTNFKEISKFMPYVGKYDIIIGTRYSNLVSEPKKNWFSAFFSALKEVFDVIIYGHSKNYTAKVKQGRWRQFVSRGGNLAFTVLLGQSFSDSRCGFKFFSRKAADLIFPMITLPGFGFDTEVFVIAKKYKLSVIEVPVSWFDEAAETNVSLKDTLKTFLEIFEIRWNLIRGKYNKQN